MAHLVKLDLLMFQLVTGENEEEEEAGGDKEEVKEGDSGLEGSLLGSPREDQKDGESDDDDDESL